MLPEKRKKLIISCIAIIIAIIVVILLGKISSFIKNKSNNIERRSDDYSELYDYIGVAKDKDGIYKIYGINEDDEKYLDVKTFYDVKDMINIDNKIVLYSDAVNEIRYDSKNDEFYFYELDSFFNKYDNVSLTHDYLAVTDNDKISYKKYNSGQLESIDDAEDYLLKNNKMYYLSNNDIYEYDLDSKNKKTIVSSEETDTVKLIAISDKYLFYSKNDELNAYNIKRYYSETIRNRKFYSVSDEGIITIEENILKDISVSEGRAIYQYNLSSDLDNIIYLGNNNIYLSFEDNYVIIDLQTSKVWKNLDNDYIYLMKVKNNES